MTGHYVGLHVSLPAGKYKFLFELSHAPERTTPPTLHRFRGQEPTIFALWWPSLVEYVDTAEAAPPLQSVAHSQVPRRQAPMAPGADAYAVERGLLR